jgi:putative phosphonate metabolism protein
VTQRYALYAVPATSHPLSRVGADWLGRDAESGALFEPALPPWLDRSRWQEITAEPRHYGFHGTLKPPMALVDGETHATLATAVTAFADAYGSPPPVRLRIGSIGGFVALLPDPPSPALARFADLCVERFDRFRAPAGATELARRRASGLNPAQEAHLQRWGYPHVFDQFRYHMTLSGRLPEPERERVIAWLETRLNAAIEAPVPLELALFVQDAARGPFQLNRRFAPAPTSAGLRSVFSVPLVGQR